MPKKSDRSDHGTAMSKLFPDVSLEDTDSAEPGSQRNTASEDSSSTELQNSSTTDLSEADHDTDRTRHLHQRDQNASAPPREESTSASDIDEPRNRLPVVPNRRPNLSRKLGPYVSDEVDTALENVYLILRERFGGDASKSLIVEAALRYLLSDCLEKGADSELVRWFKYTLTQQ